MNARPSAAGTSTTKAWGMGIGLVLLALTLIAVTNVTFPQENLASADLAYATLSEPVEREFILEGVAVHRHCACEIDCTCASMHCCEKKKQAAAEAAGETPGSASSQDVKRAVAKEREADKGELAKQRQEAADILRKTEDQLKKMRENLGGQSDQLAKAKADASKAAEAAKSAEAVEAKKAIDAVKAEAAKKLQEQVARDKAAQDALKKSLADSEEDKKKKLDDANHEAQNLKQQLQDASKKAEALKVQEDATLEKGRQEAKEAVASMKKNEMDKAKAAAAKLRQHDQAASAQNGKHEFDQGKSKMLNKAQEEAKSLNENSKEAHQTALKAVEDAKHLAQKVAADPSASIEEIDQAQQAIVDAHKAFADAQIAEAKAHSANTMRDALATASTDMTSPDGGVSIPVADAEPDSESDNVTAHNPDPVALETY